jgi:hypothetical protein
MAGNPAFMDQPVHLFDPPPAYLRNIAAVAGYHFAADAIFQGETKPVGTTFTYSIGPGSPEASVTIEILDPSGRVIRSMEGPADPGLHRVVWDLREDNPFQELAGAGRFRPSGLEVLPGAYGVRIRVRGSEATGSVEVLADPRLEIPLQIRLERRQAVQEGTGIMATMLELQTRLEEAIAGIEALKARLGRRQDAQARGVNALADSVLAEGEVVGEAITRASRDFRQIYSLEAVRDAPTESDRIALVRAGESLDRLISRFNAFLVGRVRDLRERAETAGIGPLPDLRPVVRRGFPEGGWPVRP